MNQAASRERRGRGRGQGGRQWGVKYRYSHYGKGNHHAGAPTNSSDTGSSYTDPDNYEPCKVFVANLRPRVVEKDLQEALSTYVTVEKVVIIKDKHTHRSKRYGFVSVSSPEEVQVLLNLSHVDRYLFGQEMKIKPAKKRIFLPGDDEYMMPVMSNRAFELEPLNEDSPTIHMLVDDAIYKILEYLPIRELVKCERVCRRWQVLVHGMFAKTTKLEIAPKNLGIFGPITRPIISKLLFLAGPTLKSLKLQSADYATKSNFLKIIGRLCPVLESLDVSRAFGINFFNISNFTDRCKSLKTFIAQNCPDMNDSALTRLLESYPQLEKLNVSGCTISGKPFACLTSSLKELNISHCNDLSDQHLMAIGDKCPNLEVLEIPSCRDKVLQHIGRNCTNLWKLTARADENLSDILIHFKNLQVLSVESTSGELHKIVEILPQLESLTFEGFSAFLDFQLANRVDFSAMRNLKYLKVNRKALQSCEIKSLSKCTKLEEIYLQNTDNVDQDVFVEVLQACPNMKKICCPKLSLNVSLIRSINKIMETRTGKIRIEIRTDELSAKELLEAQYDNKKIDFVPVSSFHFHEYEDDDESVLSDGSLDDSWLYGYDSDHLLPDYLYYGDHLDFLADPLVMYGFGFESGSDFSD